MTTMDSDPGAPDRAGATPICPSCATTGTGRRRFCHPLAAECQSVRADFCRHRMCTGEGRSPENAVPGPYRAAVAHTQRSVIRLRLGRAPVDGRLLPAWSGGRLLERVNERADRFAVGRYHDPRGSAARPAGGVGFVAVISFSAVHSTGEPHRFPGRDGGTCINEAALVAAGFAYTSIAAASDMPTCFSRPICQLAMFLNDNSTDEQRQRLLSYVTRLACTDTPEVEELRATYIRECICNYDYYGVTFDQGLEVLEGALAIGRQADPLGPDDVRARLHDARVRPGVPA